jgi:hypothetical protein
VRRGAVAQRRIVSVVATSVRVRPTMYPFGLTLTQMGHGASCRTFRAVIAVASAIAAYLSDRRSKRPVGYDRTRMKRRAVDVSPKALPRSARPGMPVEYNALMCHASPIEVMRGPVRLPGSRAQINRPPNRYVREIARSTIVALAWRPAE